MEATKGDYTKKLIRAQYLEKRRALPHGEWELLNTQLADQLRTLKLPEVRTAHVFLPIKKFGEPDTLRLVSVVNEMAPQRPRWVISRSNTGAPEMYHFVWDENTVIRENQWGIPEPLGGYRVEEEEIDLVFIPLLAFDRQGHRVGYGKGYYDRFLAKCRPDVFKLGISLFAPVPRIADTLASDIPLDACLTPQRIYNF